MLSIPDMALLSAAALLLFGPEQLPKVLRKVGQFTREVQNTSQSFIREMERAAEPEPPATVADDPYAYDPVPYETQAGDTPLDVPPYTARPSVEHPDPPAPDPERPSPVGEKLAEPRGALEPWEQPTQAMTAVERLQPAKAAPEDDHPVHI
jgi:Sec-independent protein translocase protein TatA